MLVLFQIHEQVYQSYQLQILILGILNIIKMMSPVRNKSSIQTDRLVLQLPTKQEVKCIFFVPTYVRLQIYNITELSLQNLNGKFSVQIKLDFDITHLPNYFVQLIQNNLRILFFLEDEPISISEDSSTLTKKIRVMKDRKVLGYRLKRTVSLRIVPDIYWTPFEVLTMVLSISIEHVMVWSKKERIEFVQNVKKHLKPHQINNSRFNDEYEAVGIKFNMMDYPQNTWYEEDGEVKDGLAKIIYGEDIFFGNYDLAERNLKASYTNSKISQKLKQFSKNRRKQSGCFSAIVNCLPCNSHLSSVEQDIVNSCVEGILSKNKHKKDFKLEPFRNAHFQVPLYRIPIVSIVTLFLPTWLLAMISLVIYFQDFGLADRIASIATVMLAYVAFTPVIRAQIPPSPKITFVEFLIYLQIVVTLLCLLESFLHRDADVFTWQQNPFFLISLCIVGLEFLIVVSMLLHYYFFKMPGYNMKPGIEILLSPDEWSNPNCDAYFTGKMQNNPKVIKLMPFTKCEESDDENLGHYEKVLKNRQIHKTSSISNMVQRGHSLSGHSEDRTNYDPFLNQRNQVQYKNIK